MPIQPRGSAAGAVRRTGRLADLDQAVTVGREAVDATTADHPNRVKWLSALGEAMQTRYGRTGELADLDQAITLHQAALGATPADHSRPVADSVQPRVRAGPGSGAPVSRRTWTRPSGSTVEAVDTTPAGRPPRLGYLSNLWITLQIRFGRTGQQADLDQAITRLSEAVDTAPAGHPDRPRMLSSLGNALETRFERTGQQADLDQAITRLSEAVDTAPAGHPARPRCCPPSGTRCGPVRAHRAAGGPGPGHHPTVGGRRRHPAGHPDRPVMLSGLGIALRTRFGRTGQQADLDQAITGFSAALDATPTDHPDRARWLSNLGIALRARSERTGWQEDLDRAVTVGREVVDASPADHPSAPSGSPTSGSRCGPGSGARKNSRTWTRPSPGSSRPSPPARLTTPSTARYLSNLGTVLQTRFWRTGELADLDQAVIRLSEAVDVTPADHPRPGRMAVHPRGRAAGAVRAHWTAGGHRPGGRGVPRGRGDGHRVACAARGGGARMGAVRATGREFRGCC